MTRERLFLLVVILLAAFMRLFRFSDFMEFLGDQGRDAIVMKRILVDHDLTLLGPGTSVGKMYLGPLYYYAAVPFLALTYPQPTGPAYAVAFLGILTTFLVYRLGSQMVGKRAAGIAALLYAVSPTIVALARFSWQPNPAPLFGLLMLWCSWKAVHEHKPRYWVWVAVCFAVLSQLHYIALVSIVPAGLTFLVQLWQERRQKDKVVRLLISAAVGVLIVGFSTLPLVAFDLRHDHLIRNGFREFLAEQNREQWTFAQRLSMTFVDAHGVGMRLTVELLGFSKELRKLNTVLLGAVLVLAAFAYARQNKKPGILLNLSWLLITIVGLSAFRQMIYNHYYAYVFPISMLVMGVAIAELMERKWLPALAVYLGVGVGVAYLILKSPYFGPAPVGLKQLRATVATLLLEVRATERYNIASLNDQHEYKGLRYRYFFDVTDKPPLDQYTYDSLDKLIVIVENNEDPDKSPIYEIQRFLQGRQTSRKEISLYDATKAYIYTRQ